VRRVWYAAQEIWTEAVQHAIAAGDMSQALGWIKNCAMDLVKRGDLLTLLAWQRLFPPEVMRGQPSVKLAIAWAWRLPRGPMMRCRYSTRSSTISGRSARPSVIGSAANARRSARSRFR